MNPAIKRDKAKNIGRGCAIADWVSKGGESYALLQIDEDGVVTLSSAVTDTGPGVFTMMRQIVGEELKVPLDAIRVEMLDSTKVIKDTGVRGSSSTRVHGSSALDAARKMRDEILNVAARVMNATPDDLIIYDGGVTHGRAERRMTYAEIARANGEPLTAEGHYVNMADGPEASLVAQVAEVEVDDETGEVRVKKLTTAHNTGHDSQSVDPSRPDRRRGDYGNGLRRDRKSRLRRKRQSARGQSGRIQDSQHPGYPGAQDGDTAIRFRQRAV